mmetsp:Transcript_56517/g.132544  ORF Transcript_56517/g.132544 Transcript_56517/m.132544 type:complete len:200 (-) Transcript_56517:152-751(-)
MGFGDTSAKDKKAQAAAAKADASKKATEDQSWDDADKNNKKKAEKKAEAEAKADAKLQAKKEKEELEAAENEANEKTKGASKPEAKKLTQAEIARRQMLAAAAAKPAAKKKGEVVAAPKVEENTNRQADLVDATGVDSALSALDNGGGKTEKITYKQFEARELQKIKDDNPGLKHEQAKDRCFKMWERSPENPKNQEKA